MLAAAFVSMRVQHEDATRMPTLSTLAQLSAVHAGWQEGDALRVSPRWFDAARIGFGDQRVLVEQTLSLHELSGVRRVWLVEAGGHVEPALPGEVSRETLVDDSDDGLVVRLAALSETQVIWDGRRELDEATVTKGEQACDRWLDNNEWHCGARNEYIFVGRTIREMDLSPRQCIWMAAPEAGLHWRVEWTNVPAGALMLRAGNSYDAVRSGRGTDVHLRAECNGEPCVEQIFDVDDASFNSATVSFAGGTLALEVWAADHMDRFFCVHPLVVPASD
ncbi:MAG: hypothetical protein ACI81R_000791 [Bradymonadia bacterium]|jgi:hypothetical protein